MSVPGLSLRSLCAFLATGVSRGSMTIIFAPRSRALYTSPMRTGWLSAAFEPMKRRQSAPARSEMELVMAPLPSVWSMPTVVAAWQSLAQWSTLLVLKAARMSFWKR